MVNYEKYFHNYYSVIYDPEQTLFINYIIDMVKNIHKPIHKIIDLGSGVGILNYRIYQQLNVPLSNLTNLDVSQNHLRIAQMYYKTKNVTGIKSIQLPLEELYKLNGTYDIAIMTEVLEHIEKDIEILKKIRKILNPGGYVVITVPFSEKIPSHFEKNVLGHYRNYTKQKLIDRCKKAKFTPIKCSFFGRYSKFLWTYPKHLIYLHWLLVNCLIIKRLKGEKIPSYFNTYYHKKLILPIFNKILNIDTKTNHGKKGKLFKDKYVMVLARRT